MLKGKEAKKAWLWNAVFFISPLAGFLVAGEPGLKAGGLISLAAIIWLIAPVVHVFFREYGLREGVGVIVAGTLKWSAIALVLGFLASQCDGHGPAVIGRYDWTR